MKNDNFRAVGIAIDRLMTRKKIFRIDLAAALGIHGSTLDNWRRGRRMPGLHLLPQIAMGLQSTVEEFAREILEAQDPRS